ncbi:MAG: fibronectin type III domain-containing protein [Gemmatimonadetes bacterium]|nr:fibronectin type III domain-containing protein [Gemmatimonadota bacterium]
MAKVWPVRELLVPFHLLIAAALAACASAPPGPSSEIDAPVAPSHLTVALDPAGAFVLEWRDNSIDETSFLLVEDCGDSRGWVAAVGQDQTRVILKKAVPETTCSFVIFAANGGGLSSPSNVATIGDVSVLLPILTKVDRP